MTPVTVAVAKVNVSRWGADCQAIVSIKHDIVLEQHIRAPNGETYQFPSE